MFGYRLKWNFFKSNFLFLAFNSLGPTTNFFCHRSFDRFSGRTERLSNLLTINRLINTTNLLATSLSFLKEAFFIGVTIGVRCILCSIWKDYRFCLCYSPFRYLIGWVLRLNKSFADMAFFLCSLGFHHTCIGWILRLNRSFTNMTFFLCSLSFHHACIDWILWLNRSFADMAFFLCPFGRYNWRRAGLRGWLGIFFCPDSKNL